jgi:C1A family cysteine protease
MSFPSIYFDGYYRILSHTPSPEDDTPIFGDHFKSFNASALQEIDLSWQGNRILNQKSTQSCVGHATTAGMEILYKQRQNIAKNFNPFFHYALINGGSDDGAYISDSLKMAQQYGICEASVFPADRVYYKNSLTKAAYDNAARFKLDKAYRCTTFDEVCQALNLGFVVNIGILVGSNFARVDSEGIAPLPNGGGGGHSMLACGLKKHSKYGWLIKLQNSWGSNFGQGGYCYTRKEHYDCYRKLDCFAFQGVIEDPLDKDKTDDVPVVKA